MFVQTPVNAVEAPVDLVQALPLFQEPCRDRDLKSRKLFVQGHNVIVGHHSIVLRGEDLLTTGQSK